MRRKDREIIDIPTTLEIIRHCKVLRLAMCADQTPYIVPLNFGYAYEDGVFSFYFHCAGQGKKLDLMAKNPAVCFEMDRGHALAPADSPCGYGYNYESVIGSGTVQIVTDTKDKKRFLSAIMAHQTGETFCFNDSQASAVTVCKIQVDSLSAKARHA